MSKKDKINSRQEIKKNAQTPQKSTPSAARTPPRLSAQTSRAFPIVGIGASAGRLEALEELLEMQNEALRQAQDELARTRDHYADLYQFAPVGYITLDADGKILEANLTAAAMLGVERRALLQAKFSKFVARPFQDDWYLHCQAVFAQIDAAQGAAYSGKQNCEIQMYKNDGTPLVVRLESAAFGAGRERQCCSALIDLTAHRQIETALRTSDQELRKAYDELRENHEKLLAAARAKDAFLATMSHELRTPLNAILGFSEILQLKSGAALNADGQRHLRMIYESGQHLLELIDDILDLAQVAAGEMRLEFKEVAVAAVCQAAVQMVKPAADQKNLRLSVSIDVALPAVWADERRLKQILVNLLSNAVKFTPHGGRVGLDVGKDIGHIRFVVWDTGIGIAADAITHIFKPFVQLDSSIASEYGGAGLGLSLTYHMMEMHGGSISVESTVGEGSRFIARFPVLPAAGKQAVANIEKKIAASAAVSAGTDSARGAARQALILVAEDNEHNALILDEYLQSEGYRVVSARDGSEAVQRARESSPELIIMDIQMPGVDGLEAIRRLRAEARFATIPIVALTALAMPSDRERCLAAGASEYLSKPVGLQSLVKKIEALLEEYR